VPAPGALLRPATGPWPRALRSTVTDRCHLAARPGLQPAPLGAEGGRVAIGLAQQAQAGLDLLLGLAAPPGPDQQAKLGDSRREGVGVDLHQLPRVTERRLGLVGQPLDQGRQHLGLQPPRILALGHAPGLEVVQVGQVLALEQLAPEPRGEALEGRRVQRVDTGAKGLAHQDDVDLRIARREAHGLSIRHDARPVRLVDQRAEPAQAPAQGAARVVRDVPEERAEALAAMRPAGQRQIGQECPRLLGWRQRLHSTVADHLDLAQKPDREHRTPRHG
jgi:hypothetical protein